MADAFEKIWRLVQRAWASLQRPQGREPGAGAAPRRELEPIGAASDAGPVADTCGERAQDINLSHSPTDHAENAVVEDIPLDLQSNVEATEEAGIEPPLTEPVEKPVEPVEREPDPAERRQPEGEDVPMMPVKPRKEPPEERPSPVQRKQVKPRNTGGRRQRQTKGTTTDHGEGRERTPTVPRARITCRRVAGKWEIVVRAEQGFVVRGDVDNNTGGTNTEFRPNDFRSVVVVADEAGEQEERIPLFTDEPMVFRPGKDWQGDGRKVSGVSVGHFVVIVPLEWEPLDGQPPVEPESCVDGGFRAHYFHRDRDDAQVKGFNKGGGQDHSVSFSVIELNGERVYDRSQDGELFVGQPPTLDAKGMALARVGEEGKSGWGESFALDGKRSLGEVLDGREGRFFIRVYREGSGVAADSVQFRYLADLRDIRMAGSTYTPDTLLTPALEGHQAVDVEVVCCDESEVQISASSSAHELRELDMQGRTVICPADHELKEVRCKVKGQRGEVDVVLTLPRVWWALAGGGQGPQRWRDTAQTVARQEFRELAAKGDELLIDVPTAVRQVKVGFDDGSGGSYPARKPTARGGSRADNQTDGEWRRCAVPLADFLYNSQIDQRLFHEEALIADFPGVRVELMHIAADPPPRIVDFVVTPDRVAPGDAVVVTWEVEDCDGVAVSLTCVPDAPSSTEASGCLELRVYRRTVVKLTLSAPGMQEVCEQRVIEVEAPQSEAIGPPVPCAKTIAGWRRAKGFSRSELSTVPEAIGAFLRTDRRRRSTHAVNVRSLERWMNEQH